jgi:hypothetical protein
MLQAVRISNRIYQHLESAPLREFVALQKANQKQPDKHQ